MEPLETPRLFIRPFVMDDLDAIQRILIDAFGEGPTLDERRTWLQWSVLNYDALARLYQPPYGDRAVVLKSEQRLIGSVGLVPVLMPLGKLPYYKALGDTSNDNLHLPEMGLFYGFDSAYRRHGYATEAAQALIDYAFSTLKLKRMVATTEFDNEGSMGVMRKLGMTIERNPTPGDPFYMQVVGILENRR